MNIVMDGHSTTPGAPGIVPDEILHEIEIYEQEVRRYRRGEIPDEQFRGFRLQHGVYGQRQQDTQMVRIKIPQGRLDPAQLRCIANLAEQYTNGRCHLSTRQNIQMHFIALEDTPAMMRRLAEVGLTTREACADTVRNVTACPLAGVCREEVFDVTPYALAATRFFLRNPLCQRLPRKFKIAFEGCSQDHVATTFHDIGVTAVRQVDHGHARPGFRITVGGGLGPAPRIGRLLVEFAPADDLLTICEAIIRVFDRHGQRKNRHKARLKFLIEKVGFPKFRELWKAEYESLTRASNGHGAVQIPFDEVEETPRPADQARPDHRHGGNGHGEPEAYRRWRATNVIPQRQPDYAIVMIKVPIGDLMSPALRGVADLCERFAGGHARVTIQQNFALRWVHQDDLRTVYDALEAIGLADPGAERIEDIVACPGTDTCGLGITSSKGLARALAETFPAGDPANDDLKGLTIKISGCHNACAQHHLADIGLHGVSKKVGRHIAPYYELHVGGTNALIAQHIIKVPSKAALPAIQRLVGLYRAHRRPGDSFRNVMTRIGRETLREQLVPFTLIPRFDEDQSYYVDWGETEEYSITDLGPGECATGAYEMMEGFMYEADQELYLASVMLDKGTYGHAVNKAYRAVIAASKALLVLEGVDTSVDAEILAETDRRLIQKGMLPKEYAPLAQKVNGSTPDTLTAEYVQGRLGFARAYVSVCREAFDRLGGGLKGEQKETPAPVKTSEPAIERMDLSGVGCPINYVRVKLRLEEMETGERLEVILDDGEPIRNVPASLLNDGHTLLEQVKVDDAHHRLVVEKG